MSADQATIRELTELDDAHGVLSFYAGHTPAQAADPQPTAPIEIRNQVRDLRSRLASSADRDLAQAVEARLDAVGHEIDALTDPKAHGRGRALFVGVASGDVARVALQIPFRERVIHHDRAYVRPLVAAHDEGRPAGILIVSRAGARVLRWAVGEVEELASYDFEIGDAQLADVRSGQGNAGSASPRQGLSNRERFEDRLDENHHRFLRSVTEETIELIHRQGWDRLVVSAPAKLRPETERLLASDNGVRLLVAEQAWEDASPPEVAEQAWPLLRSVHVHRERELVDRAVERAMGGNAGAVGLRNVCDALNEGRVAHLLFEIDLEAEGFVSEEGTLHPRVEGVMAQSELELTREPLFVERLVEKAIATDALVTPVEPEGSVDLAGHEGVAALLRW